LLYLIRFQESTPHEGADPFGYYEGPAPCSDSSKDLAIRRHQVDAEEFVRPLADLMLQKFQSLYPQEADQMTLREVDCGDDILLTVFWHGQWWDFSDCYIIRKIANHDVALSA